MKMWMVFWVLAVLLLGGCISQERTPYHEIALTGAEAQETSFYWPLYMGDTRAHYALWPIFKKSPGCFAILPFYNYDHGIHDVALLATRSTQTNESRLFPVWYQNPRGWLLFPFAYHFQFNTGMSVGSPLVFNYYKGKDHATVQSLLYYSEETAYRTRRILFPLAFYSARKDQEDYELWTPLFRRGVETRGRESRDGAYITQRRAFARNALFSLYGSEHNQAWRGTKAEPRQTLTEDSTFSWTFPFWWQWGDNLTGERGDLLFPFFLRHVDQLGASGSYATPLVGWSAEGVWWYALNYGRYHDSRWVLPFALWTRREKAGVLERNLWTPLGYANTTRPASGPIDLHEWGVGPLLPILANGDDDNFNLLGGLLWDWERNPLADDAWSSNLPACAQCRPRNTGTKSESTCSKLLLGTLYLHTWKRDYEAESLAEERPLYIEQDKTRLGLLLWAQEKRAFYGDEYLPEGVHYPGKTGFSYSLLGGLWSKADWLTKSVESVKPCGAHYWSSLDYRQFRNSWYQQENVYGWLLWKDELGVHTDHLQNRLVEQSFRTPLWGWGTSQYQTATGETFDVGRKMSFLLALYRHEDSVEHFNDGVIYTPHGAAERRTNHDQSILGGLIWEDRARFATVLKPTTAEDVDPATPEVETMLLHETSLLVGLLAESEQIKHAAATHGGWTRERLKRDMLCSLLYNEERYRQREQFCDMDACCEHHDDPTCDCCLRALDKEHVERHEVEVLWGLLANYTYDDVQHYEREVRSPEAPAQCKMDYFNDRFTVLLGIPYSSTGERDGTRTRKGLLGLLFDQRVVPAEGTETFGILGYLYRFNRHADGTRERLILPFIRTTARDEDGAASFSFCGDLLKYERRPDGSTDWTVFWL